MPEMLRTQRDKNTEDGMSENSIWDQARMDRNPLLEIRAFAVHGTGSHWRSDEEECDTIGPIRGIVLLPSLSLHRIFHVPTSMLSLGDTEVNNTWSLPSRSSWRAYKEA